MNHFACREKVCCCCWNKKGQKGKYKVNEIDALILKKVVPNYDLNDPRYPIGICDPCKRILNSHKSGNKPQRLDFKDYEPVTMKITFDITEDDDGNFGNCDCDICQVAKLNGPAFRNYCREPKLKTCQTCGSAIARGSNHSVTKCNQLKLQNLTEREKELVAYEYLKSRQDPTVKLCGAGGGNKLQVSVGSQGLYYFIISCLITAF